MTKELLLANGESLQVSFDFYFEYQKLSKSTQKQVARVIELCKENDIRCFCELVTFCDRSRQHGGYAAFRCIVKHTPFFVEYLASYPDERGAGDLEDLWQDWRGWCAEVAMNKR